MKYSKDGKFIKIIGGTKGSGPGQFDVPHAIALDMKGRLLVVDEQPTAKKPRVQIFDQNGTFIEEWANIGLKQPTASLWPQMTRLHWRHGWELHHYREEWKSTRCDWKC